MPPPPANFWRAPLVPIAISVTAGIVLDRLFTVPLFFSSSLTVAAWLAWFTVRRTAPQGLSLWYLWAGWLGLGVAYHHWFLHSISATDIRHRATEEPLPARVRGVIHSEPSYVRGNGDDPLRTFPTSERTRFVLQATHLLDGSDWLEVSGLVQMSVEGRLGLHVGDRVEAAGRLFLPEGVVNPGGFDYAAHLHDQGVGSLLQVPAHEDAIVLREQGWPGNVFGWLAVVRAWGQERLADYVPARYQGLAAALLLGEGTGMTSADWDKYVRTGVIHVLAISGQHLAVLAGFLWFFLRLARVSRKRGALVVAVALLGYALLVGARPPVMRAAWGAMVFCGGMFFQRPVLYANVFAFAWLGVLALNPTDVFNAGCQLSFLAVAVLFWGTQPGVMSAAFLFQDPKVQDDAGKIKRLIDESRPWAIQIALRWLRWLLAIYLVTLGVWLAVSPLVAEHFHSVSPVALVLGPPLVLLTSVALIGGFVVLLTATLFPPAALVAGFVTGVSLSLCEMLVDWGLSLPLGYFFVPDVPRWWLCLFYLGLFALLTGDRARLHARVLIWLGAAWLVLGLGMLFVPPFGSGDLRCTFLAVGHGGCTVIQTSHGQMLLYDAGAIGGPDVTRRHIAPFLWSRGIRRIDEVFLSHADLDHFNGLVDLLERFSIDRISCTPSFSDRNSRGVAATLAEIERRRIPLRILKAGDVVESNGLRMDVLHPPLVGPHENENSRSMVLHLRYEDWSMLLTGDLEGAGLDQLLAMPRRKIEVLMAPHHGSERSKKAELADWAQPKIVVSCQGPPKSIPKRQNPYEARGARYLTTWGEGAVSFIVVERGCLVETYRTKRRWDLGNGP